MVWRLESHKELCLTRTLRKRSAVKFIHLSQFRDCADLTVGRANQQQRMGAGINADEALHMWTAHLLLLRGLVSNRTPGHQNLLPLRHLSSPQQ